LGNLPIVLHPLTQQLMSTWGGPQETMEKCSEIVTEAYSMPPNTLQMFDGDLPPGHRGTDRRQRWGTAGSRYTCSRSGLL